MLYIYYSAISLKHYILHLSAHSEQSFLTQCYIYVAPHDQPVKNEYIEISGYFSVYVMYRVAQKGQKVFMFPSQTVNSLLKGYNKTKDSQHIQYSLVVFTQMCYLTVH